MQTGQAHSISTPERWRSEQDVSRTWAQRGTRKDRDKAISGRDPGSPRQGDLAGQEYRKTEQLAEPPAEPASSDGMAGTCQTERQAGLNKEGSVTAQSNNEGTDQAVL